MARLLLVHAAVRSAFIVLGAAVALSGPACTSEIESSATPRSPGDDSPGAPPSGGDDTALGPDGKPRVSGGCVITGCNDQLCSDRLITTDCQPTPQDACFATAICERGDTGSCRWRPTDELHGCLARAAGMSAPDGGPSAGMRGSGSGLASDAGVPNGGGGGSGGSGGDGSGGGGGGSADCRQTGCFGELCSDRDVEGTDCQWQDAYACYYSTTCERQSDGRCGWTPTDWLDACIELSAFGGFGF